MITLNKKYIKISIFIICLVLLFAFQKTNYLSVKSTVEIFLSSVLPSLFPFILFTNIITKSNIINLITSIFKKFNNIMSVIIIGFLCGYPMGAKTTYEYYENNKITKKQAYFLMSFANNCNPIFILSTIGICVFNNLSIGIILCISHYLSALLIGIIYFLHNNIIHENVGKSNIINKNKGKILHKNVFEIVDESIKSTLIVLGNIFSFILIFNLLFSIIETILLKLNIQNSIIYTLSALFEVTNGCRLIYLNSGLLLNMIICITSFMLGFSGFSIIFQVFSCIYKANIKLSHIIKYKLIQGILSFIITYFIVNIKNIPNKCTINLSNFSTTSYFIIIVSLLFIFVYSLKKVTQK